MVKSICLFCSLGCEIGFKTDGGHVLGIDYKGPLCPRGHYNLELINHPQRLTEPQIGQRKVSWGEALSFLSGKIKEFDADSVGILLSANSSNEDAYLAAMLAKTIGTKNIAAADDLADLEAYEGNMWEAPGAGLSKIEEIGEGEALLIVGDALTRSPVLAKQVNKVKYGKRGNKIIVIDPNETHTSWFATSHLKNRPGTEVLVLGAMVKAIAELKSGKGAEIKLQKIAETVGLTQEQIISAAQDFSSAASGTIIFVPGESKARNDLIAYFVKVIASLSPNKKYIIMYGYGNTLGVNLIFDRMLNGHASYPEVLLKIESGKLKALLMLGEDVSSLYSGLTDKIKKLNFIAMSNYFASELVDHSALLLPLAGHLEESATYALADGRLQHLEPVAPRVGGRSNCEIIASLLDTKMDLAKIKQETKEVLGQATPLAKVDLEQKVAETKKIVLPARAKKMNITHFGNNSLVKNFFWYKVNERLGARSRNG